MQAYKDLLNRVLLQGRHLPCRNSSGTVSKFGEAIELDLSTGVFPLLTLRELNIKPMLGELAAFLHAKNKASEFEELGCKWWSAYGENLGPIYGVQWRNWGQDQLVKLIDGLIKDPFSRRHILSTWNHAELDNMCLPPCHMIAQYDIDDEERLNCQVYMRSVDLAIGLPADIVLYAALQYLIALYTEYKLGKLAFVFGNAHIYNEHIPGVNRMLKRDPLPGPQLQVANPELSVFDFHPSDFALANYQAHERIAFEMFK